LTEEVTFGQILKRFRQKKGITSRHLSQMVGKGTAYVSQIERNLIKKPDPHIAYQLLEAIGCNTEQVKKILTDLNIADEKIFIDQKVFKEKIDPIYIEFKTNKQHEVSNNFFNDDKLHLINEEIHETLRLFILKDFSKAEVVWNNIFTLITKDRELFNFFCKLLENDYSKVTTEIRNQLIHEVNEIYSTGVNK
jgi:transcriptional regulator with XRE-family HTH domain